MKIQRQRWSGFGNKKRNTASCCLFSLLLLPWFFDIEFSLSLRVRKNIKESLTTKTTHKSFSLSLVRRVRAGPSVVVIVVVLWTKKTTISSFFASYTLKKLFSSLLCIFFCLTNRKEKRDNDGWGRENGKTHTNKKKQTHLEHRKKKKGLLFFSSHASIVLPLRLCEYIQVLWCV